MWWSWERSTQQSRLGSRYWLTKTPNLQSWLVVWDCFGQCCSTSGQSQFVHLSCASLHFITLTYGCIAHAQLVFKMCICISKHQSVMIVQVHDSSSLYLSYRVRLVLALESTCSCAYTTYMYVHIFVDVISVSSLFSRYEWYTPLTSSAIFGSPTMPTRRLFCGTQCLCCDVRCRSDVNWWILSTPGPSRNIWI